MDKKQLRILIVDDSPEDHETIQRHLKKDPRHEYEVLETYTGEEGLKMYRSETIDCVFLDYRLPDMDGLEVMGELADESKQIPVPVIFFTGSGSEEVAVQAMKSGAADYLNKNKLRADLLVRTTQHAIDKRRKEFLLRESEQKYTRLFNNIRDAILVADTDRNIIDCNPTFTSLFGYTLNDLEGKKTAYLYENEREFHKLGKALKEIHKTDNFLKTVNYKKKNGEIFPGETSVHYLLDADGSNKGFIGLIRDISDRKKSEEELQQYREKLENLVARRTAELRETNKKLERKIEEHKKTAEALGAKELDLRIIFENVFDVIYRMDQEFRITSVSSSLERALGYKPEEIINRPLQELSILQPEYLEKALSDAIRLFGGEVIDPQVYAFIAKDGTKKYGEISSTSISEEGKIVSIVYVARDITQKILAEKALSKSNRAVNVLSRVNKTVVRASSEKDLMNDICRIIVEDGGYRLAWVGFTGQDEEKIAYPVAYAGYEDGYLETTLMKDTDEKWRYSPAATAIRTGEIVICQNIQSDSRFAPWRDEALDRKYASSIALPLTSNGKIFGVLNIYAEEPDAFEKDEANLVKEMADDLAFGITALRTRAERNRAEEELHKAYNSLEKKIAARTEELNIAKQKAEAASRAKSDFLASMSHELRTPLNAVIGFSEILQDKNFGDLNEKQEKYINNILESGRHLLDLINDILDLSKVEAGKMKLELTTVNIKKLLENSLIMIKEKTMKHGIKLESQVSDSLLNLEIQVDERKLKQVVFNLLSNASKFTPDGGEIVLEAIDKGKEILISVSDTGVGIAPEDQTKIFDEFYQVKGGNRDKTPGTGLGLPLSKQLLEMHGGNIWVESGGKGKGSRFSFLLPVKPEFLWEEKTDLIDSSTIGIEAESIFLDSLNREIDLSKKQNSQLSLCRISADVMQLKEKAQEIKKRLKKEKRNRDIIAIAEKGYIYLVLQETGKQQARAVCDRFRRTTESVLKDAKVLCSIATLPEDGETAEALLRKVGKG
jgi:PAS domain S-box-containing protein